MGVWVNDGDTTFSQEIFNTAMAKIQPSVEPDCVGDGVGWESVALVGIHRLILPNMATYLADTLQGSTL